MNRRLVVPTITALTAMSLSGCGSSESADACEAYESAVKTFDAVIADPDVEPTEARSAFSDHINDLGRAADIAEGEVRLVMRESRDYAAEYERSPTEDNGTAFFIHQNRVVDACDENNSSIDIE